MLLNMVEYRSKELIFSLVLTGILILISFIFVNSYRKVRRYESLAIFVLLLLATIPFNVVVCHIYYRYFLMLDGVFWILIRPVITIMIYLMLLSAEELIFGIIGRKIWKRQKDFFE